MQDTERKRIIVTLNATIKDHEKCKTAMEAVVADAYTESATKTHFWCLGEDGQSLFVLEQYDDAEAVLAHVRANPPSRNDFFASIDVVGIAVYGDVTAELRAVFAPLSPVYMGYYGGFSK